MRYQLLPNDNIWLSCDSGDESAVVKASGSLLFPRHKRFLAQQSAHRRISSGFEKGVTFVTRDFQIVLGMDQCQT